MIRKLLTVALFSAGLASSASAQRVSFFDTSNLDVSAIAPGAYSFDNWLIDATGSLLFYPTPNGVALNYIDETGARFTEVFEVNAEGTQAVGSGTFTVRGNCPIASCLWIDIMGSLEFGTPAGYIVADPFAGAIPEPATYVMFTLGLVAVGAAARRRRAA